MKNRITYYSASDLTLYSSCSEAINKLSKLNPNSYSSDSILDIIEIYHINLILENVSFGNGAPKETIELLNTWKPKFNSILARNLKALSEDNILSEMQAISREYFKSMIELDNKYKCKLFTLSILSKVLDYHPYYISDILKHKHLVCKYGHFLHDFLIVFPDAIDLLLKEKEDNLNLKPLNLTSTEINEILNKYISKPEPNLNVLRSIMYHKNTDVIIVPPSIRITAKKLENNISSSIALNHTGMTLKVSVSTSIEQEEAIVLKECTQTTTEIIINPNIIKNWSFADVISQLNLFDLNGTFTILNHKLDMSAVDELLILNPKAKHIYPLPISSRMNHMKIFTLFSAVVQIIDSVGAGYFNILRNEYQDEFKNKYNYPGLSLCPLTNGISLIEKIRAIIPEIENIVHQYSMFVKTGTIDSELLTMENFEGIDIVPSLLPHNIICFNDENKHKEILYILFSDQCLITYQLDKENHFNNLYDFIISACLKEDHISITNLSQHYINSLRVLETNRFITINNDIITPVNLEKWIIYRYLYDLGSINYYRNISHIRQYLYKGLINGEFKGENTLFSKEECDYLNYMLNDSKFTNGMKLRNKYMHGKGSYDEPALRMDYIYVCYVLTLIIGRINNDLLIKKQINTKVS